MNTLTPEQRLQRANISLMRSKEFCLMSGVIMCGESKIKPNTPTAYTDGWNAYYGEDFVSKLTEKELNAVVVHENLHKMLKQLTVWKSLFKEDARRANMACVFDSSLVSMSDGSTKRADSVCVGDMVATPLGGVEVLAVRSTTKDYHCELVTSCGYKLYCTHDHKVLTSEGYKHAYEIQEGDLVCVDRRSRSVLAREPRKDADEVHGHRDRDHTLCGVPQDEETRAIRHEGDCEATELQGTTHMVANGLGVLRGPGGRGGYSIVQPDAEEAPPSVLNNIEHITESDAVVRVARHVRGSTEEHQREILLENRDERVRVTPSAREHTPVCKDSHPEVRHLDGDNQDSASRWVSFPSDTTHHVAFAGVEGVEYAGVTGVRLFSESRRVIDLTTTGQCFVADGIVVHNCDYVINLIIEELDPSNRIAQLPEGALIDHRFEGMNTKEVFDALNGRGGKRGRKGTDKGNSQDEGEPGEGEPLDEHGWAEAEAEDGAEGERRADEIERAIQQGKIIAGKAGSGGSRTLDELTAPKIDWREQLRDFVTSVANNRELSTWRKPNRRYLAQGVYMPSMYSESVGEIVVAIDTSGSIGGKEIAEFASELVGICDTVAPDKVHLLWWDTQVAGHQEFAAGAYGGLGSALKPAGGGGTDFSCVGRYMQAKGLHPEVVVCLTDGYVSDWGAPLSAPTLFAVTSRETAPFGVTIKLD